MTTATKLISAYTRGISPKKVSPIFIARMQTVMIVRVPIMLIARSLSPMVGPMIALTSTSRRSIAIITAHTV